MRDEGELTRFFPQYCPHKIISACNADNDTTDPRLTMIMAWLLNAGWANASSGSSSFRNKHLYTTAPENRGGMYERSTSAVRASPAAAAASASSLYIAARTLERMPSQPTSTSHDAVVPSWKRSSMRPSPAGCE